VNIGNPEEFSVKEFATLIKELTGSDSAIVHLPATVDDPHKRKPDISLAKEQLGWEPRVPVTEGLAKTVEFFKVSCIIVHYVCVYILQIYTCAEPRVPLTEGLAKTVEVSYSVLRSTAALLLYKCACIYVHVYKGLCMCIYYTHLHDSVCTMHLCISWHFTPTVEW
jgi:hypothetical protein